MHLFFFFSDVLLSFIWAINAGVLQNMVIAFPDPSNDREVKQVPSHYTSSSYIVF